MKRDGANRVPLSHPTTTKVARNNREIARALGLTLPKQRNKLAEKMAEIEGIKHHAKFPPKQKGGYDVLALKKFALEYASEIAEERQRQRDASQILNGHATPETVRRVKGRDGEIPNQEGLANHVNNYYRGQNKQVFVTQKDISDWLHGRRMPSGAPPFPAPDCGSSRWKSPPEAVYAWIEEYYLKPMEGSEGQGDFFKQLVTKSQIAELQEKINKERLSKLAADEKDRELSDKWMLVAEHNAVLQGLGANIWSDVYKLIEERLIDGLQAKLKEVEGRSTSPRPSPPGEGESKPASGMVLTPELIDEIVSDARERHLAGVDELQRALEARCGERMVEAGISSQ